MVRLVFCIASLAIAGCVPRYTWDLIKLDAGLTPHVDRFVAALELSEPEMPATRLRSDRLLFARALNLMNREPLEAVSADQLTATAISALPPAGAFPTDPDVRRIDVAVAAMVSSFDPNGAYLDVLPAKSDPASIGLALGNRDGAVLIVDVEPGSPADHAGVRPFDVLVSVDGRLAGGLALEQVVAMLQGRPGSPVTITVQPRGSRERRVLNLTRAALRALTVRAQRLPGDHVYARITAFLDSTRWDLETEITRLDRERTMKGLVLDLRHNSGGGFAASVAVARLFISSGNILTLGNRRAERTPIPAEPWRTLTGFPIVVITNKGTAAGAELVTAALVQNGRARSVGTTTSGYDTVQTFYFLSHTRALKLTTHRIYSPDGASLASKLVPQVVVPEADADMDRSAQSDPVVQRAVQELQR